MTTISTPELKTHRRNLLRWQESRLARLDIIVKKGMATPRQSARRHDLANAIMRSRFDQSQATKQQRKGKK